MNIGVLTVAFNEKRFIKPCIKQFDGFNFPHLVLISNKPWRGDYQMDETWAIAKTYNELGSTIIDYWPDQASQFNDGLEYLKENRIDWTLIVDADEFYTPKDIGILVGQIRKTKAEAITCPFMQSYWKSPDYRLFPEQDDNPIIAIRTDQKFIDKRNAETSIRESTVAKMHHMSYVRDNEEMMKKIETFEHSHEFDLGAWYKDVWSSWTPDSTMLHPTVPSKWERAVYNPAPYSIRSLLNK
jgi:glycosyltransferase involved in cell wall biosynthesis